MTERVIECELDIDSEPAQVWQALTQAEHIRSWFAPYVESEPGVGGHISLSWNDPSTPHRLDIVGWEINECLSTDWFAAPMGQEPINLPLTIRLEPAGPGRTKLRLVQSGFLSDVSWDDEYESHSRGWNTELRSLRYYVEEQLGRARLFLLEKIPVSADWGDQKPLSVSLLDVGIFNRSEGQTFSCRVGEENWQCKLIWQLATSDLVFVTEALDGGFVRLAVENITSTPELWFWAFSWRISEDELVRRTQPLLDQIRSRIPAVSPTAEMKQA
jgi:uncharacterized protein YndB with AHSA1/START domain